MPAPPTIASIPTSYGDAQAEYAALRDGCAIDRVAPRMMLALDDRSELGRLEGRLVPRPLAADGACRIALLLNEDGLLTSCLTILDDGASGALVDASNPTAEAVFAGAGIGFAARRGEVVRIRLRGPRAVAVLTGFSRATPTSVGGVATDAEIGELPVRIARTGPERAAIYCELPAARRTWDTLVAAGALPVGSAALETVRIEDAEPCLERDFSNPVTTTEAGFVEFGGEPTGDRVLVLVEYGGEVPHERATIYVGDEAIGDLRSSAWSVLRSGRPVGLARMAVAPAVPGAAVEIGSGARRVPGTVVRRASLPASLVAPNY